MELLQRIAQYKDQTPNKKAIQFDNQSLTYEQLIKEINSVADRLAQYHLNHYVGILCQSSMTTLIHYLALHQLGIVPIVLDFKWSNQIIEKIKNHYNIIYIISDDELNVFHRKNTQLLQDVNIKNILHIGFTSGTTGLPKAYLRDEPSWIKSFEVNERLMMKNEQVIVAPGPIAHSLTLYACIYALFSGRTFIGQNRYHSSKLIAILKNSNNLALFIVPTMLKEITHGEMADINITSIFSSGDKLEDKLYHRCKSQMPQINIIEFFGTSETSFISYNLNNSAPNSSVGKLFDDVSIKFANVDDDNIGRILVKSDMTFNGYINEDKASEWVETGDYGYLDEENYLYLTSRHEHMLVIGGNNVYPFYSEALIKEINGVNEAIIVGMPHKYFGQLGLLIYTGTNTLTYNDVKSCLINKVKRYEIPSKILKVKHMIYTSSGKIDRASMLEQYLRSEL